MKILTSRHKMSMKMDSLLIICSSVVFFILMQPSSFASSILHKNRKHLSIPPKPDPADAAATARWLVEQNIWGVLSTISGDMEGAPFGNVVSFSDGLPNKGLGIPYFYLTSLDPTARYASEDARASFTISEFSIGSCGDIDPENPTCAKLTLNGKLKIIDKKSAEGELARQALFSKHSEMKDWPKDHDFQIFKLSIEKLFLIDWFGGAKPISVPEYLKPKQQQY